MDITKRIEKVKEYFIKFNIEEGAITLALKFPTKWTIPDAEFLKTQYNVVAGVTPYGVIYGTESANGFEKKSNWCSGYFAVRNILFCVCQ